MSLAPPQQQQQQEQAPRGFPRIVDISTDKLGKETYIKAFLLDDTINENFWHIPTAVMKKHASSFVGRPLIYHPSGQHPDYIKEGVVYNPKTFVDDILKFQNQFKVGDIIYVNQQHVKESPSKKAWYATIRVTNPDILQQIKSGNLSSFVSPQIYDINGSEPNQATTDFIPLHLAIVDEPAYGSMARIKATCTGTGASCVNALKSASGQQHQCTCGNSNKNSSDNGNDNDSSSFLKNSASQPYTLTNQNYREDPNQQQMYQDPRYRPEDYPQNYNNPQGQQSQPPQNQVLNEKTQRQEVDANGNLITKTEDKKPVKGNNPNSQPQSQQQGQQQQVNPNSPRPQTQQAIQYQQRQPSQIQENPNSNPQSGYVPTPSPLQNPSLMQTPQMGNALNPGTSQINASDPQLPSALLDALKEIDALKQQLGEVQKFKQTAEEKQLRDASEQQKQLIESFITPDLVPDESARQEMINYFASLNLQDDQIKTLLDLLVSGKFNAAPPTQNPPAAGGPSGGKPNNVSQAAAEENIRRVKGASLIMNNRSRSEPKDRYYSRNNSTFSNGFLTGINPEDLQF